MRKSDVLLIVLFIVFVLGLAFGPALLERWRERNAPQAPVAEQPAEQEPEDARAAVDTAEVERVSGMLMLHKACVNRFDGFDAESRAIMEAWQQLHETALAQAAPAQDFHIVLAQPEGLDEAALAKARAEERALCDRNLDAMRADIDRAAGAKVD